jgi:GT2 family glycosyltransferase
MSNIATAERPNKTTEVPLSTSTLSVIIVNYNVKYFLEQALLSVRNASQRIKTEVFVVDNNSVDDSVAMVKEKFPEVILIANKDNVGFSKANNQAIRQSTGDYVLLLNPDTVVEEDTFEKCMQFMDSHPDAGGLGVKMIDGSGKFLPESKRGFPSPFVAFCKTFGLSSIFPKSKLFNRYHLGFLDKDETNEVDILAGAFMLMRKSTLDKVGLLDETFFLYGEDIDLSYRITQGGYKNYYFPETTIIHYKGESTKKGSLNYVKVFYNAMIIFANKHFQGQSARLFTLMLRMAIYFRAALTLVSNLFRKAYLPLLDALGIFIGMYFLKDIWARYRFNDPDYYDLSFLYFNVPLYISIWIASLYFSGSYDEKSNIRRLVRGLFSGTVVIAAIYGFLDLEYRTSRALIIMGALWATTITFLLRVIIHAWKYGNLKVGKAPSKNLVIVGTVEESERVQGLLHKAQVSPNFIGTVAPHEQQDPKTYLSNLQQLDEVVQIYKVDEIIFCSQNVSAQSIMQWMTNLGPSLEYKIVPEESLSIIGSSSKNTSGQLYTIDIQFNIAYHLNRRNKRLLDVILAVLLLCTFPIHLLFQKKRRRFLPNIFHVLIGKKSWVGYAAPQNFNLPKLKPGILSPVSALALSKLDQPTIERLDFFYAKDYDLEKDLDILWKGYRELGS